MPFRISALPFRKSSDVDPLTNVHPHSVERRCMSHRGYKQCSGGLESYKAAVKQMINAGCQQKPVFPVQALIIRAIAPRFAVACTQMLRIGDTGDAASPFDYRYSLAKYSLAATGLDDCLSPVSQRLESCAIESRR